MKTDTVVVVVVVENNYVRGFGYSGQCCIDDAFYFFVL